MKIVNCKLKICRGFTLIELMIVVVIVILLTGGGIVYLNRFNAVQKVETTKDQLITNLRSARNYAITRQLPQGAETGEDINTLKYISAGLNNGILTVKFNDVGTSYFSKQIAPSGVGVSISGNLWFAAADGKLVKEEDVGGSIVPVGVGESITSIFITTGEVGESRVVEINASGLINEK